MRHNAGHEHQVARLVAQDLKCASNVAGTGVPGLGLKRRDLNLRTHWPGGLIPCPLPPNGCQQGVSGSHGYSMQSELRARTENRVLAAKPRNSTHSTAIKPRDHNPRVGGSSPSSGIGI
jgi:hypothetical protein